MILLKTELPHFKAAPLLLPGKDLGIVLVVSYSVGVLTNGKNEKFLGILLREMFPIMSQRLDGLSHIKWEKSDAPMHHRHPEVFH